MNHLHRFTALITMFSLTALFANGQDKTADSSVFYQTAGSGKLEISLDDLQNGKLIAANPIAATGSYPWKTFSKVLKGVTGQHDVFVKFPLGQANSIFIKSIKFLYK